ncbi:myb/SANT-like DNA-binding domain-containing protein 4 [Mytilus edulis]|uniref:myb/SANT-like DNA-binding domain-containing protein 4 n=1 Tax=Mytilus edulis TaxID=6550 RepID=UPI0039EF2D05
MSRKRSPNFTEIEIQIMLAEVEKHKGILFSKLSNVATNNIKKKTWDGICTKMNSSNTHHKRSVEEIRKKWTTYMSSAKQKVSHNRREARKTGGGPPPEEISSMEDQVLGIIGDTPIDGIDGGIDTASFTETSMDLSMPSCSSSRRGSYSSADESELSISGATNRATPTRNIITTASTMEDSSTKQLVQIEKGRLNIDKERLQVEKDSLRLKEEKMGLLKERLEVEKERLRVEKDKLSVDRQRLQLEQAKEQLRLAQLGISLQIPENSDRASDHE